MVVFALEQMSCLSGGSALDDLHLRMSGIADNHQMVRLSPAKCTIGSAEECTLRLPAAGIRPLECLILRGPAGMAVRCYSGGTRLNGQAVDDSFLAVGDRLTIGPVELVVLGGQPSNEVAGSVANATGDMADLPQGHPANQTDSSNQNDKARQRPVRARQLARRAKALVSEVRSLRGQLGLAARDEAAYRDRILEMGQQIDALRSELQFSEAEGQRLAAELDASRGQLAIQSQGQAAQSQSRQELEVKLRIVQDAFEQERAAWAMENAKTRADLEHERDRLAAEREEAARFLTEVERQRQQSTERLQTQLLQIEQEQQDWNACRLAEEARMREEAAELEHCLAVLRHDRQEHEAQVSAAKQLHEQAKAELETTHSSLARQKADSERRLAEQRVDQLRPATTNEAEDAKCSTPRKALP
jgi:hypothetical protein